MSGRCKIDAMAKKKAANKGEAPVGDDKSKPKQLPKDAVPVADNPAPVKPDPEPEPELEDVKKGKHKQVGFSEGPDAAQFTEPG